MKTLVLFRENIAIVPRPQFFPTTMSKFIFTISMEAESSPAHIEQQEWQIYSFPPPKNIGK
jgi:hypothetical protein